MPHGSRHACLVNMCRQIDGHVEILGLIEKVKKATVLIRQAMERSVEPDRSTRPSPGSGRTGGHSGG